MALNGLRFTLAVDGLPERLTAVTGFRLYQHYSVPFVLEVNITAGLPDLTGDDFLEKHARLTLLQGSTVLRCVSGIVSEITAGETSHGQTRYDLTIVPPLWRAGLRRNFRIFQQHDIETITATLLDENGVTDRMPLLYEPHPAREFCVQYGGSDLAFLTRLWAEEGIFYFDRHTTDGQAQRLVLCDDMAGVASAGDIPFNPDPGPDASVAYIRQFHSRARVRPAVVHTRDHTFKAPLWPGHYRHSAELHNGQRTAYEVFDYPGRFKDEQHGEAFARYRLEGWQHDAQTASCLTHSPALWPGRGFTLTGHPSPAANRAWQVVSSVLTGDQPQALHGSQGEGTTLENRLEVMPADRTWRRAPLPKPCVDGPQGAVVTGPPGEEIFCDEHGRVRVRFFWDRYSPGGEDSSCWIRVSQAWAWAGAGFGSLALPRVGQEVIVDFLHGDPDQPVVTGRLYHDINRPPGSLPGTRTQMTLRSKTYKGDGFNELRFDDATGHEQVYIRAQKNMDTVVLNNCTTDVKADHTGITGHNRTVTVGNDQHIRVHHDRRLQVTHDRRADISHDDGLYVANDRTVTVEGREAHTTRGDHLSRVEGTHSLAAGGDLARQVSGALGVRVQGDIVLESRGSITLKAGASFVVIHPGGVDISGPVVNLNGGGRPGTPVGTLEPGVLTNEGVMISEQYNVNNVDGDTGNNVGPGSDKDTTESDDSEIYNVKGRFTNDKGIPYSHTRYIAYLKDGSRIYGETDHEGKTEIFTTNDEQVVEIRLLSQNIDMVEGGVNE